MRLFLVLTLIMIIAPATSRGLSRIDEEPKKKAKKAATRPKQKKLPFGATNASLGPFAPRLLESGGAIQDAPSLNYLERKVERLHKEIQSRPPRIQNSGEIITIEAGANRPEWLQQVYAKKLVEASPLSESLCDKLVMARVLEKVMGEKALQYYPKTMGLKQFLAKHHFINKTGHIVASGEQIEAKLHDEFPKGFVARPAVGIAPYETEHGLVKDGDNFIVALLKKDNPFYRPEHAKMAVRSHILNAIASGEAVVLQEDLIGWADALRPLRKRSFQELRVHTYEGKVVEGAVPHRWTKSASWSEAQIKAAEEFVAEFLKRLPSHFVARHAWGVDVAILDNGAMRISDIVTNKGLKVSWSGYLEQPRVIGAYTKHFEKFHQIRFTGVSGALLRNNMGNYFSYWEKRREKAQGWEKLVSYLPPIP